MSPYHKYFNNPHLISEVLLGSKRTEKGKKSVFMDLPLDDNHISFPTSPAYSPLTFCVCIGE